VRPPRNGAPQAPPLYVLSHLLLEKPLLLKSLGYHKKLGLGAKEEKLWVNYLGSGGAPSPKFSNSAIPCLIAYWTRAEKVFSFSLEIREYL